MNVSTFQRVCFQSGETLFRRHERKIHHYVRLHDRKRLVSMCLFILPSEPMRFGYIAPPPSPVVSLLTLPHNHSPPYPPALDLTCPFQQCNRFYSTPYSSDLQLVSWVGQQRHLPIELPLDYMTYMTRLNLLQPTTRGRDRLAIGYDIAMPASDAALSSRSCSIPIVYMAKSPRHPTDQEPHRTTWKV